MKFFLSALLASSAAAFTPSSFNGAPVSQRVATKANMSMETSEDLAVLAKKCNPLVGFFDPLGLAEQSFWDTTPEATIGFLREAEIKHGRVAMAAFVGFIVHANGIRFPWSQGYTVADGLSPQQLWDSIPEIAKWQICLLYTSPSPRDLSTSRMPSSA